MPGRLECSFWLTRIEYDPDTCAFSVPLDAQVTAEELAEHCVRHFSFGAYAEQNHPLTLAGIRVPHSSALRIRCLLPGSQPDTPRPLILHLDADQCPYVLELHIRHTDQTVAYFPMTDPTGTPHIFALSSTHQLHAPAYWPLAAELLERHRSRPWLFSA